MTATDTAELIAPINQNDRFIRVKLNDLEAVAQYLDSSVAAVLIEGIQGVGGIQLPENMTPAMETPLPTPEVVKEAEPSNLLKGSCNSCSLKFQVPMPAGVNEAIVVCPSCSEEQLFQR